MKITLSFVLTVGLGCGLAQPAWAQTKQSAWQRLTGIFKSKNQKDQPKKETPIEVRVSPPSTPYESRGVVLIEEPKTTSTPQPTGKAVSGVKKPAAAPAAQRTTTPAAVVSPAPSTPPKVVPATSTIAPRNGGPSQPAGPPKIIESAAPRNQPRTVAPPVTATPVTATPANYPKAAAPVAPSSASRTLAQPAMPTKAVKAPLAKRDLTRLTRQISQACPKAKNVKLTFTSATEVTLEMDVTTAEECKRHAEHIFAIRELDPYSVNLKFNVPQN